VNLLSCDNNSCRVLIFDDPSGEGADCPACGEPGQTMPPRRTPG
jgi:hypothetical protein